MHTAPPGPWLPLTLACLLACTQNSDGAPDGGAGPAPDLASGDVGPLPPDGGTSPAPGPKACVASTASPAAGAKRIYVSPTGNDTQSGTSAAAPLRTIAAALAKAQAGDVVQLAAGATFNEVIEFKAGGAPGRPIIVSSDPQARARIVAPAGKSGVAIGNLGHITVENLIITGPGMNLTRAIGVRAVSDGGRFADLAFRNLDVSGFNEGIQVLSYKSPTDGFDGVLIELCALHHNLQGGGSTYGTAATAMRDVVVRCGRFYDNPGDPSVRRPSGDGFVLGGVTGGLLESCVAYNNGGQGVNNAGPVGLWAYDSSKITIQFSESYGNKAQKMDGDGFDLDIGVTDSVIQYCYSHDNFGAGYLFSQGGSSPWRNNVLRYNISENDGLGRRLGAITLYSEAGPQGLGDGLIYGNTVYSAVGPALNLTSEGNVSGVRIFNNIFVTAKDQQLVWDWSGNAKAGRVLVQGNLYWASGGKVDFQGATSLAAWRAAQGQEVLEGQPVGLFADPLLRQPGGGRTLQDPLNPAGLSAYQLRPGSPALGVGLDPRRFGVDPGPRDYYGTPLPSGVGYDIGAQQTRR